METKKIILSTIILWIVGTSFAWLTCGWLFNWIYEIPPLIWHSPEEMMAVKNMVLANIFGILVSFIFVYVYAWLYKKLPGKGVKKGILYGLGVWALGSLSGLISLPLFMTIAPAVVVYWITQSLVLMLIDGAIVGKIFKK